MFELLKVNHFYEEKSKVLKTLYDHWEEGERGTNFAITVTDVGRSLSVLDLQDKTTYQRRFIEQLVISLSNAGHINLHEKDQDPNQKNHKWIISESGRQAIADNYYLNQQGIDNRQLLFQFGGFLFGLLGIVISVISLYQNNSLERRIDKLEYTNEANKRSADSIKMIRVDSAEHEKSIK